MKKTKTISMILTAVITAGLFCTVLFTACSKSNSSDPCSGVTCQNGGSCSAGSCICPTGWTGAYCQTAVNTSIIFQNNTFTPVNILRSGITQTIPVGDNITYTGTPGSSLNVTANTSGLSSTGTQIGLLLSWTFSNTFPTTGSSTYNIDVSSYYFFLKIKNTSTTYSGAGLYVNYGLTSQTYDGIAIPNTGVSYNTGYYNIYSNTEIYIPTNPTGSSWSIYPATYLPNTSNQSFTFSIY